MRKPRLEPPPVLKEPRPLTDNEKRGKLASAAVGPAREAIAAGLAPRAWSDLPVQDDINGVAEVAKLTAYCATQRASFSPVIEALNKLRSIPWDPNKNFYVVDTIKRTSWAELPARRYNSFADFYSREIEPTWGKWDTLQRKWRALIGASAAWKKMSLEDRETFLREIGAIMQPRSEVGP